MSQTPPASRAELQDRILGFIAVKVAVPIQDIPLDLDLAEVGVGSLEAIELLFAVEEEYDLDFTQDEARSVRTVRGLIDLAAGGLGL